MLRAILWEIATNAEACPPVVGTPFRVARAQRLDGGPILEVLFTINSPELCSLWWAYLAEPPDADEESGD